MKHQEVSGSIYKITRRLINSAPPEPAEKLKNGGRKGLKLDIFGEKNNPLNLYQSLFRFQFRSSDFT
jgi:hypothetical protein